MSEPKYVYLFPEGYRDQRDLLGGKGHGDEGQQGQEEGRGRAGRGHCGGERDP